MAPSSPTTSRRWSLRSARERDLNWSPHPQVSAAFCRHSKPQGQYTGAVGCPGGTEGIYPDVLCVPRPPNWVFPVLPKIFGAKYSWSETVPACLPGASPDPHQPLHCLLAVYEMMTPLVWMPWAAAAPQKPAHMAEHLVKSQGVPSLHSSSCSCGPPARTPDNGTALCSRVLFHVHPLLPLRNPGSLPCALTHPRVGMSPGDQPSCACSTFGTGLCSDLSLLLVATGPCSKGQTGTSGM